MNEMARRKLFGLCLVLPAFLFVFCVLFLPAMNTIVKSFTEFSPMNMQQNDFTGMENYKSIFGDEEFMESFFNTLHFAGVSVFFELIFGLALALILNKALAFRGVIRTAILFPWVLPTALNAIIWRWLFNTDFGFFNNFMKSNRTDIRKHQLAGRSGSCHEQYDLGCSLEDIFIYRPYPADRSSVY